ncbi:MAG: BMC domain-containing protein [Chloroflexi bacterium]|nr:BMC domain-containing protein [Chloroflexota bacterium]
MAKTLGIIEGNSYVAVLTAADRATKAADIHVMRYERIGEHDVAVVIDGDTADVQIALHAAAQDGTTGGVTTAILTNTRLRGAFGLPRL